MSERALYSHRDLTRLINPGSIAIIGVSANPGGFGSRTLANLKHFSGRTYAINPKYGELHGVPCHASIAALPEVPDCVVIALPREGVEAAVEACAAAGVGGVVIFASGYTETGLADRIAQQQRLVAIGTAANTMTATRPTKKITRLRLPSGISTGLSAYKITPTTATRPTAFANCRQLPVDQSRSNATPSTTGGIISGERNSAVIASRPVKRWRATASAAGTDKAIATVEESAASAMLDQKAMTNSG